MKVLIDKDGCIACGMCTMLCPEVFEEDDEGYAQVHTQPTEKTDSLLEAVDSCPTGVISIEEE